MVPVTSPRITFWSIRDRRATLSRMMKAASRFRQIRKLVPQLLLYCCEGLGLGLEWLGLGLQ